MAETLGTLGPNDILSCWTALWTKWDEAELTKVRMGFIYPQTTQLTECDYVGPGVSMFNKRILFHPGLARPRPKSSTDRTPHGFPWLTSMELGSRKFYMPSYGMLRIHPEVRTGGAERPPRIPGRPVCSLQADVEARICPRAGHRASLGEDRHTGGRGCENSSSRDRTRGKHGGRPAWLSRAC